MDKYLESVAALKIPSLIALGLFFWTGKELLINSQAASSQYYLGFAILIVGAIYGSIMFIEYRYREQVDHTIRSQTQTIDNLTKALSSVRRTHDMGEKNKRETMTGLGTNGQGERESTYTIKDGGDTAVL